MGAFFQRHIYEILVTCSGISTVSDRLPWTGNQVATITALPEKLESPIYHNNLCV